MWRCISGVVGIFVVCAGAAGASWDLRSKIMANDFGAYASFGHSVALRGGYYLVGAPGDEHNGVFGGSVYLYTYEVLNPSVLAERTKVTAVDAGDGDAFGYAVAMDSGVAVVGAYGDSDNGIETGSAYVVYDLSTWYQGLSMSKVVASDGVGGDAFGYAVAVSGGLAVIGAPESYGGGAGGAYVFDISNPAYPVEMSKLVAGDGAAYDFFGSSVAVNGNIAVIGSPGDDDNGSGSGSVYIFDLADPAHPVDLGKVVASDAKESSNFGVSLAVDGISLIVGAELDDGSGPYSGSAYVFDISNPAIPIEMSKLTADIGGVGDSFGCSVAVSGGTVAVGSYREDLNGMNSGGAYFFDISDPANPVRVSRVQGDLLSPDLQFGGAVALDGSDAVIGAVGHGQPGFDNSGMAYCYELDCSVGFTAEPTSVLVDAMGGPATLAVGATGCGALGYQWYKDGVALVDGAEFSGAQSASLDVQVGGAESEGVFWCEVTGSAGTVPSESCVLGVRNCEGDSNYDTVIDVNDISYVLFRLGDACP